MFKLNVKLRVVIVFVVTFLKIALKFLDFKLAKNRRGGENLHHGGYVYRKKKAYSSSINWVCVASRNNCQARAITNDIGLKLGKSLHNHPPNDVIKSAK